MASGEQLAHMEDWFGFAELTNDASKEGNKEPISNQPANITTATRPLDVSQSNKSEQNLVPCKNDGQIVVPIVSKHFGIKKFKVLARQKAEDDEDCKKRDEKKEAKHGKDEKGISKVAKLENPTKCEVSKIKTLSKKSLVTKSGNDKIIKEELLPKPKKKTQGKNEAKCNSRQKVSQNLVSKNKKLKEVKKITKIKQVNCIEPVENAVHDSGKVSHVEKAETLSQKVMRDPIQPSFKLKCNSVDLNECSVSLKRDSSIDNIQILMIKDKSECEARSVLGDEINTRIDGENTVKSNTDKEVESPSCMDEVKNDMVFGVDIDLRKSGRLKSSKCASRYRGDYGIRAHAYTKLLQKIQTPSDSEESVHSKHSEENMESMHGDEVRKSFPVNMHKKSVCEQKREHLDSKHHSVRSLSRGKCKTRNRVAPKSRASLDLKVAQKINCSMHQSDGLDEQVLKRESQAHGMSSKEMLSSLEHCGEVEAVGNEDVNPVKLDDEQYDGECGGYTVLVKSAECPDVVPLKVRKCVSESSDTSQQSCKNVESAGDCLVCSQGEFTESQDTAVAIIKDTLLVKPSGSYVHSVGKSVMKKQNQVECKKVMSKQTQNAEDPLSPVASPEKLEPSKVLESLRCKLFERAGANIEEADEKPKVFECKLITSQIKGKSRHDDQHISEVSSIKSGRSTPQQKHDSSGELLEEVAKTLDILHKKKRKTLENAKESSSKKQRFEQKSFMLRSKVKRLRDVDLESAHLSTSDLKDSKKRRISAEEIDKSSSTSEDLHKINVGEEGKNDKQDDRKSLIDVDSDEDSISTQNDDVHENSSKDGRKVQSKKRSVKCQACGHVFKSRDLLRKHYPCRIRQTRTWSQNKLRPKRALERQTSSSNKKFVCKLPKSSKTENKVRPQLMTFRKTKFRRVKGKRRRKLYQLIQELIGKRKVISWPHLKIKFNDLSFKEQSLYKLGLVCVGNANEGLGQYSDPELQLFEHHRQMEKNVELSSELFLQNLSKEENLGKELNAEKLVSVRQACDDLSNSSVCEDSTTVEEGSQHDSPKSVKTQEVRNNTAQTDNIVNLLSLSPIVNCQESSSANEFTNGISSTEETSSSVKDNGEDIENQVLKICDTSKSQNQVCNSGIANTSEKGAVSREMLISCNSNSPNSMVIQSELEQETEEECQQKSKKHLVAQLEEIVLIDVNEVQELMSSILLNVELSVSEINTNLDEYKTEVPITNCDIKHSHALTDSQAEISSPETNLSFEAQIVCPSVIEQSIQPSHEENEFHTYASPDEKVLNLSKSPDSVNAETTSSHENQLATENPCLHEVIPECMEKEPLLEVATELCKNPGVQIFTSESIEKESSLEVNSELFETLSVSAIQYDKEEVTELALQVKQAKDNEVDYRNQEDTINNVSNICIEKNNVEKDKSSDHEFNVVCSTEILGPCNELCQNNVHSSSTCEQPNAELKMGNKLLNVQVDHEKNSEDSSSSHQEVTPSSLNENTAEYKGPTNQPTTEHEKLVGDPTSETNKEVSETSTSTDVEDIINEAVADNGLDSHLLQDEHRHKSSISDVSDQHKVEDSDSIQGNFQEKEISYVNINSASSEMTKETESESNLLHVCKTNQHDVEKKCSEGVSDVDTQKEDEEETDSMLSNYCQKGVVIYGAYFTHQFVERMKEKTVHSSTCNVEQHDSHTTRECLETMQVNKCPVNELATMQVQSEYITSFLQDTPSFSNDADQNVLSRESLLYNDVIEKANLNRLETLSEHESDLQHLQASQTEESVDMGLCPQSDFAEIVISGRIPSQQVISDQHNNSDKGELGSDNLQTFFDDVDTLTANQQPVEKEQSINETEAFHVNQVSAAHDIPIQEKESSMVEDSWEQAVDFDDKEGQQISNNKITFLLEVKDNPKQNDDVKTTHCKENDYAHGISFSYNKTVQPECMKDDKRDEAHTIFDKKMALQDVKDNNAQYESECDDKPALMDDVKDVYVQEDEVTNNFDEKVTLSENMKHVYDEIGEASENYNNKTKLRLNYQDDYDQHELYKANDNKTVFLQDLDNVDDIEGEKSNIKGRKLQINDEAKAINMNNDESSLEDGKNSYGDQNVDHNMYVDKRTDIRKKADDQVEISNSFNDKTALAEDVKNVAAQEDIRNICTDEIDEEDVKRVDDIMNLMEDFCMKVRMSLSNKDAADSAKMNREEMSSEGTLPLNHKTLDDPGLVPVTSREVPSVSFLVEATPGKQTADECHILPEQSEYKMLESSLEEAATKDRELEHDFINQSSDMSCDSRNSELLHLVDDKNMNDKPDDYSETLKDPQIQQVNLEHSSDEREQTALYANEEGTTVLVGETNDNKPETRSTANRTGEKSFITTVSPHLEQQFNPPMDKEDSFIDSEGLSDHEEMEDTDSSISNESSCRSEISNKLSLEGQCKTPCAHLNKDKDSPQANICTHANMPCKKVNPKESSNALAKDLDSSDESSVPVQKILIDQSSAPIQKILIDKSSMPIQKVLISPQTEFTIKYEVNGIMIQENLLTGDKSVIENHDSSESDFALSHHTSDVDKDEIMKEENSEDDVTENTTLVETHKENTVKHAIDTKKTYGNSTTESNFESMPLKENQTPNINSLNEDDIDEMRHDSKEHEDPFNTSNLISECSIASTLQDTADSCEDIKGEVLIERDLIESPPFLEKIESIHSESLKEVPDQAYEWVDGDRSNESGPPLLEPESSLTIEPGCVDSDSSNKENITEYGSEPTSYHTSTRSKSERHFLDVLFHSDEAGKVSEESGNIIGGDGNSHGHEKVSDVELQEALPVKESIGRHFSDVMDDPYSILQLRKKVEKPKLAMAKIKEFFDSKSTAKTFSKESLLKVRTGIADLLSKVKAPLKRDPTWLNRNALSEYSGKQGAMMYKKLKDKDTGKSSLTVYSDNDSDTDASDKEDESGLDYENCEHSKKKWIDDNSMCLESSTKGGITNNILQMLTSFEAKGSIADNMTSLLDILAENLGLASKSCKTSEIDSESEYDNTNETEIVPDEPSIDMVTTADDEPPCLDDIPTAEDFRPSPSFVNKYHIQKNNEKQTEEECQTSVKYPLFLDQERENMEVPKFAADLPSYDNIKNQTENVKKSEIFEIVPDYETNSFSLSKLEPGYFESSENIIKWVQQTEESPCTSWPSEGGKKHGKLFKSITELNSIEADDSNSEDDFINVPTSQQFSELKAMSKNAASEVNSDLLSKSDLDSIHEETVEPSTGSQKYEVRNDTLPKENRKTYCVAIEENSAQVDDVEEISNFDVQSCPDVCSLISNQEDLQQQTVNKEKDSTESQDIAKELVLTVSSPSSIKMGSELYSEKMQANIIDQSQVANDAKVDEQGLNSDNIPDYTVTDLQNEVSEKIMDCQNNQNGGLDGNDKNNSDKSSAVNDYNIIPSKNSTRKEVVNVTNNGTVGVKTAACVDVHRDSGSVEDLEQRLEQIADKKADSLFVSEDSNCTIEYSEDRSAEQAIHENQSCCDDLMVSLLADDFTFCETIAEKVKRKQRERLLSSAKCQSFSLKNTAIQKPKGREISIFRSAIQEKKKMKYQKRQMSVPLDETRTRPGFARDLSVPKEFKTLPCSVRLSKIPLDILIKECCKPCSVVVRRLDKKKIKALTKTSANENNTSEKPKPPIKVKINLRTLCVAPPSPCCPESCSSSSISENKSIIDEDMERSDLDQNNFEDLEKETGANLSSDEDSENVDSQKKSVGNRTPIRLNFRELLFKAKRDNEENSSDDSEALQSSLCDVEEDMKQDKKSVDKLSPSQYMTSDVTEDGAADNCSCDELQNSPQQKAVSNDDNDEDSKQWYENLNEMPPSHLKLPGNKEKSQENFIQAMHLGELNLSESDTDNETDDFDAINESILASTLTSVDHAISSSQSAKKNSSDISSITPELNKSNQKFSVVNGSSDMLFCAEQGEVDDSHSQDDVSGNQETDDGSLCSFVLDSGNKNNSAFSSNNDFQRYLPEIDSEHTVCSLGRSNSFEIGENMVEVDSSAEAVITLLKTEEISNNFTDSFDSTDFCSTKEQELISEAVSELEKMTESIFNVGDSNYLHADDLNEQLQVAEESIVYYANEVVDNGELNEAVSNLESLAVEEATVIVEENFVEVPTIDENSLQVREQEIDNMEEMMNPGISLGIESCKYMYGVMEDSPCPAEVLEETVTESIEHVDYVVDEIDMKTANVYCTENNVLDISHQQKVECDLPVTTTSLVKDELGCTSSVVNSHGDRAFKCSNPQTVCTVEVTPDEVPLPDSSLAVSISPPCAEPYLFCNNLGIYSEKKPPNHTETRTAVNSEVNSNENTVVTAKSSVGEHEADGKNRNDLYEKIDKQLRADMPTMSTANTESSTGSMTEKEIKKTSVSSNENLRTEQLTECDILDKTDKTLIEKEITNDNKLAKTRKTLTAENICGNNKLEETCHSLEKEDRYDNSVIMETDDSKVIEEFTEKSTLKMKHETTVSEEIAETYELANIKNMPSNTTLCKGEFPVDTAHGETSDSDCVMECVTEETTDTACVQEEDIVEDEDDVEDDNIVMNELEESTLENYGRNADGDASHEQVESQCQSSGMEHEQCVVRTRVETYSMHHNVPAIEVTNKCGDKDWDYVSESVSDDKVVNEFNDVPEGDLNCDYGRTHLGKPVSMDSEVNFISESGVQTGLDHSVVKTSCVLQGQENQIGDDSYPVSEASHSGYHGYSDTVTDDSDLMEEDLDFKVYKVADTDEEEEQAEEEMAID